MGFHGNLKQVYYVLLDENSAENSILSNNICWQLLCYLDSVSWGKKTYLGNRKFCDQSNSKVRFSKTNKTVFSSQLPVSAQKQRKVIKSHWNIVEGSRNGPEVLEMRIYQLFPQNFRLLTFFRRKNPRKSNFIGNFSNKFVAQRFPQMNRQNAYSEVLRKLRYGRFCKKTLLMSRNLRLKYFVKETVCQSALHQDCDERRQRRSWPPYLPKRLLKS